MPEASRYPRRQSPPVTKLARHKKPYCLCPAEPKVQARHLKGWMHRCHRSQMKNTIFQLIKTVSKSTWVPGCLPILATLQVNRFGHRTFLPAALLLNARNYPRVWWSEKPYWVDSERTLRLLVPFIVSHFSFLFHRLFHLSFHHSRCVSWQEIPGFRMVLRFAHLVVWPCDFVVLPLFLLPHHVKMIQCCHSYIN